MIFGASFFLSSGLSQIEIKYALQSALIDGTGDQVGFKLVENANGGIDGLLEYVGDGTEVEGTAWIPSAGDYPQDGTIKLEDSGDGKGSKRINTQQIIDPTKEQTIVIFYNTTVGSAFIGEAIHMYGNGTIDVWKCSESGGFTLTAEDTGISWTPPVDSFKITKDPMFTVELASTIHVSFYDGSQTETQPSSDETYINALSDGTDVTTVYNSLFDENNVTNSNITLQVIDAFSAGAGEGYISGNDSYCVYDFMAQEGWYIASGNPTATVRITLPAGKYSITASSFRNSTETNRVGKYTLNGIVKTIDASTNNTGSHCATWTGLTGGQYYDLLVEVNEGSSYAYLNGIIIEQTA